MYCKDGVIHTKVNCPDASPAADIESSIYVLDGCKVLLLIESEPYDVVLEVCGD